MFTISSQLADNIYALSNVLLVIGTTLVLIGTVGVFWSGGVREKYSDERISANEAETAKAKATTEQAKLEQERLKSLMAWRRISPEQAQKIKNSLDGFNPELWLSWVGNDPETTVFRTDLNAILSAAGVKTKYFSGYVRAVGLTVRGGTAGERARLVSSFKSAGLNLVETTDKGVVRNELEITVGTKPPPDFSPQ